MNCYCCGQPRVVRWTDVSFIAACTHCNAPYNYPVVGDVSPAVDPEFIPVLRAYWEGTGRRVAPRMYDITEGRDPTTVEDGTAWVSWLRVNLPKYCSVEYLTSRGYYAALEVENTVARR